MTRDPCHHIATRPAPGAPLVLAFHCTGGDKQQFTGLLAGIMPDTSLRRAATCPNPAPTSLEALVTAGRRDPICPLPSTEALVRFLQDQDARVDLRLHDGGHEVSQSELDTIATFPGRAT